MNSPMNPMITTASPRLRLLILVVTAMLLAAFGVTASAQDATATATATTTATTQTTDDSTINYYFVACENSGVFDFNGFMNPGFDIYVQIFAEGPAGPPLTDMVRVAVNGDYSVSPNVPYTSGSRLAGQFATARVIIARENNPANVSFETTINEVQDGCIAGTFAPTDVTTADGTSDDSSGTPGGVTVTSSGILSPFWRLPERSHRR